MNIFTGIKNHRILMHFFFAGTLALLICLFPAIAESGQGNDLFASGNQAYAEGKYDEAISYYKAVMEQEGYSASLLYNMANAYYQKKDVGHAILNYERALYLDPKNADIQANLSLARKDFGLISEPAPMWQKAFNLLNLNWWTLLASGALGAFSFLCLIRGIRPRLLTGSLFRVIATVCLLFFMVSGTGIFVQYGNMSRGVVTRNGTHLLVSPFDSAASSSSIKDGKVVQIARIYKDYVLVKGPNGKSGWIKNDAIEPVVPSSISSLNQKT
jgi:tetratricopeptide (TPR) repeat protein